MNCITFIFVPNTEIQFNWILPIVFNWILFHNLFKTSWNGFQVLKFTCVPFVATVRATQTILKQIAHVEMKDDREIWTGKMREKNNDKWMVEKISQIWKEREEWKSYVICLGDAYAVPGLSKTAISGNIMLETKTTDVNSLYRSNIMYLR